MCQHLRADFGAAAAFCKFICHPIRACQSINLLPFAVLSLSLSLSPLSFRKIDGVIKKRLDRIVQGRSLSSEKFRKEDFRTEGGRNGGMTVLSAVLFCNGANVEDDLLWQS